MSEEKTRILPRKAAAQQPAEPRVVNGQIVFFCPAGHRLAVPVNLGGKRGKCGKCGVFLQIPLLEAEAEVESQAEPAAGGEGEAAATESVSEDEVAAEAAGAAVAEDAEESSEPVAETLPDQPPAAAGGWNFVADDASATGAATDGAAWSSSDGGQAFDDGGDNPTARLVTRLWAERNHGGIIELHLVGGNVILPEEFAARWSRGTHGLFASQAADGTVTLTAVAWDTIQRIVVRQLAAVPDDMFE